MRDYLRVHGHDVRCIKVRSHNGNRFNDEVDHFAGLAAETAAHLMYPGVPLLLKVSGVGVEALICPTEEPRVTARNKAKEKAQRTQEKKQRTRWIWTPAVDGVKEAEASAVARVSLRERLEDDAPLITWLNRLPVASTQSGDDSWLQLGTTSTL